MGPSIIRFDLRAVLPVTALGVVVLVIILVELCGRGNMETLVRSTPVQLGTPGPTFTPGPSPTPGLTVATATQEVPAGGEQRDVTRVRDLAAIAEALQQYREENGSYPTTEGNIQTLCAFVDLDAGCALEEVLSPLPQDPLGDPVRFGYFYSSTGTAFSLYAKRESDQFPECQELPSHIAELGSLLCTQGS